MGLPKDAASPAPSSHPPTPLQSHVAFFDTDSDGIIWPLDTFRGFRAIGFGVILSLLSMLIIHGSFSYLLWGSWIPDPFWRLRINLMHRAIHGSDSGSYNHKGEFDKSKFDDLFASYASPPYTSLSCSEGIRMIHGNRNPFDLFGWFAAIFEWGSTYLLLWPEDGRIKKEDVRGILDGSLFYKLAKENGNHVART